MPELDLQTQDFVSEESVQERYQIHHRPSQKWYYISEQTSEEAWIFLQVDSNAKGMIGVPHSAFPLPVEVDGAEARESIEVRALVIYNEE